MSFSHKVGKGDTLGGIALKYTGNRVKWVDIVSANPQLAGRKTAVDGSPLIFPGDVLIIPDEKAPPEKAKTDAVVQDLGGQEHRFSLLLNGVLFTGFTAFKLIINDDSPDVFSFSAPFDPEQDLFKTSFKPLTYLDAVLYFDKEIIFAGNLLFSDPKITPDSRSVDLQGYARPGVLDCTLPDTLFPPSYSGMTLSAIAKNAVAPFGISVVMEGDEGAAFADIAYDIGDKILDFLTQLAKQRGLVSTNAPDGALKFWNNKPGKSCATFKEGEIRFIDCTPTFNERDFYSHITGYAKVNEDKDTRNAPDKYTFENEYLTKNGVLKPYAYVVDDSEGTDLEAAVRAKAASMLCACISYDLTVTGVTDKDGAIWQKGCCITVQSPTAQIYQETKLQAKSIELSLDDSNGLMTKMHLVLPGLRNSEIPSKWPWEV